MVENRKAKKVDLESLESREVLAGTSFMRQIHDAVGRVKPTISWTRISRH